MSTERITRRQFLKTAALSTLATTSTGVAGLIYGYKIEPQQIQIEHLTLKLPRLNPAFDGYRLVQISDLHVDHTWMSEERLLECMRLVNEQKPDAVAITGDFVSIEVEPFEATLIKGLQALTPRDNTVAVLGNHDHWADAVVVRRAIYRSGIADVNNSFYTVQRGEAKLHFCGVDDIMENQQRLDLVLDTLPADGAAILLAHEPDFADVSSQTGRFDLQLSGHSHGGQVRLPLIGPIGQAELAQNYPAGLYKVNGMYQYTNRGLGMVTPQIRFYCPPEITVFTLRSGSI
ncbi:MAG: putative metallophosphoesterase YkuE [Chloroflexota bacterium]|nr:metallophosphoesterase [Chloroflexota bacterium]NOG64624.1 metallophosphoesterase [Chloroflexota bacterium]GIK63376.1 MAG: putative metallophosphoesterase YkuE [Chloroflexota bacterium]